MIDFKKFPHMLFNVKLNNVHKMNWGKGIGECEGEWQEEEVMVMKDDGDRGEQRNFIYPFLSLIYLPLQQSPVMPLSQHGFTHLPVHIYLQT